MPARLKTSFLFLALVAQGLATALGQDGNATVQPSKIAKESRGTYRGAPVVHATFVENGPKIDGDLNDEVWQRALPAGGELFQVEHKDNVTGSEVTEFRVLYDKNNLYLGVWCFQKNPNEITANAGNDENSDGDDFVGVILDTFHDKRNGYIFLVTPNSLRVDVLVSDNGNLNGDWETVWGARCAIRDWGWGAEVAIPFKSISFDDETATWGMNFARRMQHANETLVWANGRPGAEASNPSNAGVLHGLKGLEQGLGIDVMPFLASSYTNERGEKKQDDFDFDGGIDMRHRVNSSITAQLSVNTDFADVEADHRQFNFSRFDESFPEKRAFFLEDAGIFEFPSPGEVGPYYSRKIGLNDAGEVVPIHLAAKVTGRSKDYNFGLMDVLVEGGDQPRNVFIGRGRKNLTENSTAGLISTWGDPRSDATSSSLGADYKYHTGEFLGKHTFTTEIFALGSYSEEGKGGGMQPAYGLRSDFKREDGEVFLHGSYAEVGANFNPGMGYAWRDDFRKYNMGAEYKPKYEEVDWLNSTIHEYAFDLYTDTGNNLESTFQEFNLLGLSFASGDYLGFFVDHHTDRPPPRKSVWGKSLDKQDKYEWWSHGLYFQTSNRRKIGGTLHFITGEFYENPQLAYGTGLEFRFWKEFLFGFDYSITEIDWWDPEPETKLKVLNANATINFSRDLFISNLIQYDNDSNSVGVNSRLQWEYKPGAKFFLVVNQGYEVQGSRFSLQGYGTALKLGTLFRF